jgi:hypothetical protein
MTTLRAAMARVALAGLLALALPPVEAVDEHETPRIRGRPLISVLDELQARGLNLIYSSAVVLPELVVAEEPQGTDPRMILDQILAPLGLQAQDAASGAILIVRAPPRLGAIRGRVTASPRGTPVSGAALTIDGTGLRAAADRDGRFVLDAVPAGTYIVRVSAPSFVERVRPGVTVDTAATVELAIALEPDPRLVERIVVTPGQHEIVPDELGTVRTLDRDAVIAAPALGNDPSRMVAVLPGIATADGSAAFNARGSASKDVSLILDGLELYDPFHLRAFQSPFSFIDGRIVDTVDFLGGGFTADRGDRHGGFLEMSSTTPVESSGTELEAGTLNSRVAYEAPTSIGPVLVSARYWYPVAVDDTIAFGADGLQPTFGDLYVKVGLLATPSTSISGHALIASDRATLSESDGNEKVDASNGSGYLWFRVSRAFSPTVATDTVVSAGKIRRFREGIAEPQDNPVAVDDRREVRFVGVRNDATWTIGSSQVLRGGLDVRLQDADLQYMSGPPAAMSTTAVAPSGAGIGAYVAYRAAISKAFIAEGGIRWDRQTYTGDRQWSPRLDLVWKPGERSEVRLGAGRYAQSQRIHELRIEDGETDYRPPEICEQLDLTFIHHFSNPWNLRVDAYRHKFGLLQPHYENLFHPLELFPEAEPDRVLVAPEGADLHGVELSLSGAAGAPLQWLANYTWSSAMDRIDGADVPRSWDQTHAGNFLVAYRWRPGWFLSVGGTIHTGWPTTPVTGRVVTLPDGSTEIEEVVGPRNSARYPTYARLDVKTGRAIATAKGNVRVELSVMNLTNRQNVCCIDEIQFEAAPDGSVTSSSELKYWLGITPSLQVLWSF